jgi:hypothetical protein
MTSSQQKSLERMIRKKLKEIKRLDEEFWERIRNKFDSADNGDGGVGSEYTHNRSSVIYGCINGVVLVRYNSPYWGHTVTVNVIPDRVERILRNVPIPYQNGKTAGLGGFVSFGSTGGTLRHTGGFYCDSELVASNIHVTSFSYNDAEEAIELQDSLEDFRLTILGMTNQRGRGSSDLFQVLYGLRNAFERLLNEAQCEEEVQSFLKENPILIQPHTCCYPKLKLGSEMVTDFVFQNVTTRGFNYTFVEIEKASLTVFNKKGDYHASFNHAWKQLEDWDGWLDKHLDYLCKEQLPQLSRPYRLVLIAGRSASLTEKHKEDLRSKSRTSNIEFSTYDDVLARFDEFIAGLRKLEESQSAL